MLESIDQPSLRLIQRRAIADGNTIFRAGKSVFLATDMPSDYLYQVEEDDPVITEIVSRWEAEEEE